MTHLITVDDLNDSLSPESLLNEQMKDIMIFDDLEIPPPEASSMALTSQWGMREGEGDLSLERGGAAKFDDPVRLYLKEMGTVSLLTREGEVDIAKRIEEGEREVLHSLLEVPLTFKEIMGLVNRLEEEKLSPQSTLDDFGEDDPALDLPTQKSRVHEIDPESSFPGRKDPPDGERSRGPAPRKTKPGSSWSRRSPHSGSAWWRTSKASGWSAIIWKDILERLRKFGYVVRDCQHKLEKRLGAAGLSATKFRQLRRELKNKAAGLRIAAGP